jgi:hypothetical protein
MTNKACYVYKWTHLPTLQWYVGVRYARGCHPDDGYICSSKTVKPRIEANPEEWKREILEIGPQEDMVMLESEILDLFFSPADPRCLNRNKAEPPRALPGMPGFNKGMKFSEERKKAMSASRQGYKWGSHSEAAKQKIRQANTGRTMSEEARRKMSNAKIGTKRDPITISKIVAGLTGRSVSQETRNKISISNMGKKSSLETIEKLRNRTLSNEQLAKLKEIGLSKSKPIKGVPLEGGESIIFTSKSEAARHGFNRGCIHQCLRGQSESHKGYAWTYI